MIFPLGPFLMLFLNVRNTQGHGDIGDIRKSGAYTLETCPTVEICSKTRPNRYSRSEVWHLLQFPQRFFRRTGNYCHNLLDSHRKWYSSTHCLTHRHSRGNRNSRRSCQQSVMAIFVFFYVFLWVRNCLGFFQLCFFFLSIFIVFCSILELETVISMICATLLTSNLFVFSYFFSLRNFQAFGEIQVPKCLSVFFYPYAFLQQSCSHYNAFCTSTCTFIQHVTTSLCHHCP